MKNCSYCGKENQDSVSHCVGCGTEFGVPTADSPDSTNCPNCGGAEYQEVISLNRSFNRSPGLVSTLYAVSRKQQVRCVKCDTLFFIQTKSGRIALVFLIFILIITGLTILFAIV